jgi:heterotetrameric sarcosine oxidase beta subunit
MKTRARVAIIGGGIMGLATAYHLARRGVRDVIVIERSYLCSGASGRNGGGVRAQWSTETNVRLMRESIDLCRAFAREMGINVWFRQGGYLFLVRDEAKRALLEASVKLQNANGLSTRMLEPAEAREIVPEMQIQGIVAASYNSTDGVVFPWPFVWGYARGCVRRGVEIQTFTNVTALEWVGGRVGRVVTDRGTVEADVVVNAGGAWSPEIARLVGLELPNHPHRHEIMSTESLKPFLKPLVADLGDGLYFSQSMRGEIVGGITDPEAPHALDQRSSLRFLGLYARSLTRLLPVLGDVKILRQWAGCYDVTPDGKPIVGPVQSLPGFVQICGFVGYGFMMAPVVGKIMADYLATGVEPEVFREWSLDRFGAGPLTQESMVIG